LVRDRLSQADAADGFLLDGYPRTADQVAELDDILAEKAQHLDAVVMLSADVDEVVRRLLNRAIEQGRADDTEDVIRHRLEVYEEQTAPLISVYAARDLVITVDGLGEVSVVTERIVDALSKRGISKN
jgi:adenylate kinase